MLLFILLTLIYSGIFFISVYNLMFANILKPRTSSETPLVLILIPARN
ncbi:MAG: hypothetical protein Q8Q35_02925 [Nanoarchaeota archaeon]|nr:hypothetical protein [Nanoarchaeota archaeon]